jgi:hypothetical protein
MNTEDFLIELYCRVDDKMVGVKKHKQASLYPSEVVTLAEVFVTKGIGPRAFSRWLTGNYRYLFPHLPSRTRVFRLFCSHRQWGARFLAATTVLGVIDAYGIELIHPMREGRSEQQIGKKGKSNHRWIIGGKLCWLLNQWGLVVKWAADTANGSDRVFHALLKAVQEHRIVLSDTGFHAKADDPPNLKGCPRGTWNSRMLIETVLSMLTTVCHLKKLTHRVWTYVEMHLGVMMATFNPLGQGNGWKPDQTGFFPLSLAEFSL